MKRCPLIWWWTWSGSFGSTLRDGLAYPRLLECVLATYPAQGQETGALTDEVELSGRSVGLRPPHWKTWKWGVAFLGAFQRWLELGKGHYTTSVSPVLGLLCPRHEVRSLSSAKEIPDRLTFKRVALLVPESPTKRESLCYRVIVKIKYQFMINANAKVQVVHSFFPFLFFVVV